MARWLSMLMAAALFLPCSGLRAQEKVRFDNLASGLGLRGYLYRPASGKPAPAVVMLHGCSGLETHDRPFASYRDWRDLFLGEGYVVLMVDSAASRGLGQTCTASEARKRMKAERPSDAYSALAYLQSQPFVDPDRIALAGWSQGGGVVLSALALASRARPTPPPAHDFAVALAFYPAGCSERLRSHPYANAAPGSWATAIPLLVLQGEADNWTPPGPCEAFIAAAAKRGSPVTMKTYPGAGHAFDAPNTPVHPIQRYAVGSWAPVVGTNEPARADARERVLKFLKERLARP